MGTISDDFATLYISNELDLSFKIKRPDIFDKVISYIKSKNISVKTVEFDDKKGGRHKKSYIDSLVDSNMYWRLTINIENCGRARKLFVSFSPAFKTIKAPTIENVNKLADQDVNLFKAKLGETISINVDNQYITFKAFSYSLENKVDISKWNITLDQRTILYKDFINSVIPLLNNLKNKKSFKFRVVNLTKYKTDNNSIKSIVKNLELYGTNKNENLDNTNYTLIKELPKDKDIVNVILIEKADSQSYFDSKDFFLNYDVPFQHILVDGNLQNNQYASMMVILEIYKKTHLEDFYLRPDHFNNEPIAGFIYLDVDSITDTPLGNKSDYLTISYIFSQNLDYSEEKLTAKKNVRIDFKEDMMNIIDVDDVAEYIVSSNSIAKRYTDGPYYFNLIFTKELQRKSLISLIAAIEEKGLKINRAYFVSNHKLRFVDNYNYYKINHCEHRYKILGKNFAVVKMATNSFLFPQLFSTYIRILYPLEAEIIPYDLKNVIWLSKKRIYRAFSLKNITLIEPLIIKSKNIDFLKSIRGNVNIEYLI